MAAEDIRGEEVTELLNAIKQRVRARYPSSSVAVESTAAEPLRVPLPDLMPLVYARDSAQAKVASIGSVNPRSSGPLNQIIQTVKRLVARSLSWFVRDQVVFNRQIMACVETTIEALTELNLSIHALAAANREVSARLDVVNRETAELRDARIHWSEWRANWERTLANNEMQFLRSVADLQTGFSYRASLMESEFREASKRQHADFEGDLVRSADSLQKRFWGEFEQIRNEYERLIHNELRIVRQRMLAARLPEPPAERPPMTAAPAIDFDYARFADRFRGSEDYVRSNQQFYLPIFQAAGRVLDLGCGRGEFLELLRENGIVARGIESSDESVRYCQAKGLDVEKSDLFDYLEGLPESSEEVIFCSQVVEHLDPAKLPSMIRLCVSRLVRGGLLAIETPNPECLAIFATHFYLDPTHTRPVPPALLSFYLEECGMGGIVVHRFAPAAKSFPEIDSLPSDFAEKFFGGLDYAVVARKL